MNYIYNISLSFFLLFAIFIVAGCGTSSENMTREGEDIMSLQITSSAFNDGETIPEIYTCDGANVSPPLKWSGLPEGTKSLAMVSDDPDAPIGTWVHWVIYDIPSEVIDLPEGVKGVGTEGKNDFGRIGYGGPCPPSGNPHRYFFKLYALDTNLNLNPGATKSDVEKAMEGHIIAQGELIGKYGL